MPKLCQCKKTLLLKVVEECWEDGYEGVEQEDEYYLDRIDTVLESDCVCSKEEEVKRTPSDKCLHGYLLTESCKHCYFDSKYGKKEECRHSNVIGFCSYCSAADSLLKRLEEKQSQSPCEHPKDKVSELNFDTNYGGVTMYLCKCGLVTCKNPNQE